MIPLNEPAVLRYGLRSLLDPAAPLHVPASVNPRLWSFLTRFAANCRWSSWTRAVHANLPLNDECVDAFDDLIRGGVTAATIEAPITAGFENPRQARSLLRELHKLAARGQLVEHTELTSDELREQVPLASPALTAGVRIDGQRYLDPGAFVTALGRAVAARGATFDTVDVIDIHTEGQGVIVRCATGKALRAGVAVLATGAWLSELARRWGARTPVRAGRGYSFTVPVDKPVPGPIYLPVPALIRNSRPRCGGSRTPSPPGSTLLPWSTRSTRHSPNGRPREPSWPADRRPMR